MPGTVSYTNNEPMWIVYNDVLLGFAGEGDVTLSIKGEWVDKTSHQTGSYLLDSFWKGERCTVTADIAEVDNWANWSVAFPIGEKQVDAATPPADRYVSNSSTANTPYITARAEAHDYQLVLRPVAQYVDATTEKTRDIMIPKAFVREIGDIIYSIDNAEVLPITWEAMFNPSASAGAHLWVRGLETATAGAWAAA